MRITCDPEHTAEVVHRIGELVTLDETVVLRGATRPSRSDLVMVEISRAAIDTIVDYFESAGDAGVMRITVDKSEPLYPATDKDTDNDAIVWSQVAIDVHDEARMSWINILLMVSAAAIAAIGIIEDQLLLIVGAMALSPDYFPIIDVCISVVRRRWDWALQALRSVAVGFAAAILGAWLLSEVIRAAGIADAQSLHGGQLTQFISRPDAMSVIVALLAGVAGALAITMRDARGLVGVFVSITTIPAAANIGVAAASRDPTEMVGAAVQLVVNVCTLAAAGMMTLQFRRGIR
ncbi:MAG: DUF389 domain-containing protein [Microthrixaceae bacterium]